MCDVKDNLLVLELLRSPISSAMMEESTTPDWLDRLNLDMLSEGIRRALVLADFDFRLLEWETEILETEILETEILGTELGETELKDSLSTELKKLGIRRSGSELSKTYEFWEPVLQTKRNPRHDKILIKWKDLQRKLPTEDLRVAAYFQALIESTKAAAEIKSEVETKMRLFGKRICQSPVLRHNCWAKARKTGESEVDTKEMWITKTEAELEKVWRKAEAEAEAVWIRAEAESNEVWRQANAMIENEEYGCFTSATSATDWVQQIWEHTFEKVTNVWHNVAEAIRANEMWRKAEAEAIQVWLNAAPGLMEAENEYKQLLEDTLSKLELGWMTGEEDGGEKADEDAQAYTVIVSAVALLSLIYLYLAGYVDKGGTKTYSSGSLVFRSTYVSIVLFQGSYVWIKFRDVASKRAGYRRPVTDKLSGTIKPSDKIEARYTPPRRCGDHNHIYLGLCTTHEEADIKKKIAAFYYGRHTGRLDVDDGRYFLIPPMPREEEQSLSVAGKRAWVKDRVKVVYEGIKALRAIDTSPVHVDEQSPGYDHSSPHAEKFAPYSEGLPDVAFDPEFQVKEYVPFSEADDADFGKLLEDILDSSEGMTDMPDAEPSEQHLQDNHVQDLGISMTLDNQCGYSESLGTEPVGTSYWELGVLNLVNESSEAAVISEDMVGTPKVHDFQAVSEFPVMSPVSTLQQHSDPAMAALPDMVTPSASKLCPGNSTSDLLALKVISLYEQILEKDKRIVELERENERLRGASDV
ncbi:hypothetical protein M758_10G126600 [Ceratodon purpureus]|nr:hypothetical protein M758_10G126600 [Ceratodon purpureus]